MHEQDPRSPTADGIHQSDSLDPAAEQSQIGEDCPTISNEDEGKLFRPE